MRALVFPGQGSETAFMGLARAAAHPGAARLLRLAGDATGVDAPTVLGRGGPALLRQEVLQSLILAVGLGSVLGIRDVDVVAGHSLGEVSAIAFAEALDPAQALAFTAARGRLMAESARASPGGMVAVRGSPAEIEAHLRAIGGLAVAARNTVDRWSLCGERAALDALAARVDTSPITRAGAWHHPTQAALAPALDTVLQTLTIEGPRVRVLSAHMGGEMTASALPRLLSDQLSTPVQWFGVVERLVGLGVREVVVAEPSRQLAFFLREAAPQLRVVAAGALA